MISSVQLEATATDEEMAEADQLEPNFGRQGRIARWCVGVVALPLALYVILRPENYSLTPNSLDPMFYTGYAINFDDLINALGQRHYFVTRWSAYYPMYVADAMFGPVVGRLLWRLVLAVAVVGSVWGLGARWKWNWGQRLLIGTLVLTMPIFVRAFMTDYVEYLVVALGTCLVVLALVEQHTVVTSCLVGALAALVLVANPVAVFLVAVCAGACLIHGTSGLRARLRFLALAGAAGAVVLAGGLVLFRWRYGLDNVYEPTIHFLRTYEGDPAAWKSPRLDWLSRFTWLYAPPILLISGILIARARRLSWSRTERMALGICAVQYVVQWYDQFIRDGFGLEISFYWSFMYPSLAVAIAVVVGKLTTGTSARAVGAVAAAWVVFLLVGVPGWARLPAGAWFGLVATLVVGAAIASARRASLLATVLVVGLLGWIQIGAPTYDPSAYFFLNVSPRYDELFRRGGDASEVILDEAIWFADQMDRVPNDAGTSFVVVGGWSSTISGLYAPHVSGRLVTTDGSGHKLTPLSIAEIKAGARPIVAVYGPPDAVEIMVGSFADDLGLGELLLDVRHDGGLGYRLTVFAMPDASALPFTWSGDSLPVAAGHRVGSTVRSGGSDEPGFVTFGPYVPLAIGRYSATLTYRSSAPPTEPSGAFDASSRETGVASETPLAGTGGTLAEARVTFEVDDGQMLWEFRTARLGTSDLVVESITLDRA